MSYQFFNPAPVLESLLGSAPAYNGSLSFYDIGTTDDKDTWSDVGQSVVNSNPVLLDSSGRSNTQIWLDGDYSVVLRDSLGAVIWTRDLTSGEGSSVSIPALADGFLTNDGTNLIWRDVETQLLPDPTGSTNQYPVTDGSGYVLTNVPTVVTPVAPDPEIVVTATSFRGGVSTNTSKFLIQTGTDSAPASGTHTATDSVTFPVPFTTCLHVNVTPTGSTLTGAGYLAVCAVTAKSPTGFSMKVDANSSGSGTDIVSPVGYDWIAFGLVTVP